MADKITLTRTKPLLVLLVSVAAIIVTTAQTALSTNQKAVMNTTQSGQTQSPALPDTFTLSHGTNTLRAVLVPAPPVYDPGGLVCLVEDWQGDEALLTEAEKMAATRGAVLVRVICAHADRSRAELLARRGYAVASEWYTAPLPLTGIAHSENIRRLMVADVPRVLELGEQKRQQYQAYSPVFWRMSPLPRKTFAPYMQAQIENPETVALAHEQDGRIDGFVLANGRGYIDDYTVEAPALWPTVGAELLWAAGAEEHQREVQSLFVVCAHGDIPKRSMLAAQGLTLTTDWYVRPLTPEAK